MFNLPVFISMDMLKLYEVIYAPEMFLSECDVDERLCGCVAGVIRESYQKGRDQLVPVTLLAIAVILAFAMGAIFSGIVVYCVCDHRRRDLELTGRKDKDAAQSHRGSMNSVTKLTGLFETQAKDGRPEAILTPLMHGSRMGSANAKMLIKADQHHLDLAALPTPESTPMQPRRKPSRGSREWERNQNLINACTKDLPPMGSPVIPTDLPLRASPGHIPSVVVLPLPQHQQAYQHEYVEQPHRSDLGPVGPEDQGATLEYKSLKSPCHGLSLAEKDNLPPRVPQREASLAMPAPVPQMGKRLEVHSSMYGHEYKRGYPLRLPAERLGPQKAQHQLLQLFAPVPEPQLHPGGEPAPRPPSGWTPCTWPASPPCPDSPA